MRLDELAKLEAEATAGPWNGSEISHAIRDANGILVTIQVRPGQVGSIVAFRNHAKALLAVVDAANDMRHSRAFIHPNRAELAFDLALERLEEIK